MNAKGIKKLLIVGQTPPPYHGQAIMIENTVKHEYEMLKIFHVRMNFSKDVKGVGRLNIKKIITLFEVIFRIVYVRIKYGVKNLYYPPAGPNTVPIIRDLVILGSTKWMFSVIIYHFRAGGISEKVESYPNIYRILIKAIFSKPNLTIRLSSKNPDDGSYFNTIKDVVIPNGLKDYGLYYSYKSDSNSVPIILFVGAIKETKGVLDLLNACAILKKRKIPFKLNLVGSYDSNFFKEKMMELIDRNELAENVFFLGTKTGEDKWREYAKATVFCFPSYYECETFGNVLVEAMQFKLPIVATKWRGIPDIVANNESGFLVDINSPEMLAYKIEELINNKEKRILFGNKGRNLFLQNFEESKYYKKFETEVYEVCS